MKYVLLLSGGVNDRYNYDRYASDLAFARQVMDEYLGTTEKIVQILYADVLTANKPGYPSYTRIYPEMITYQGITYKYDYDEFLYHFFAALHGSYPSGKPLEEDTDKKYTFADAYEYARLNDVWNPLHPDHEEVCKIVSLPSAIEIPQMQVFM